ncbi:Hypothetical protein R9X50_00398000 [Acrodontium crateriforme]|uniref:Ribosome biogenesis regulatory protein n=1 Tax=Acrodontium crateriforme TaxID=150365 RepID=A0AAQ3M597_9PEZI|nr:Hypothetical protein R9X50_00398000 [Acrodontium crateriforme]
MADIQSKAQPYVFDLGHLMCSDANPLPSLAQEKEAVLTATARDCAQGLINQLLTTCTIARSSDGDLQIKLPDPSTRLPREKPVPKEKEKTKWDKFAEKKGIKAKKRDGKLVYDETKGDWIPKYGYKGKNMNDGDWLVEVDEKPERKKRAPESEGGNKSKRTKNGPR